MLKKAIVFDNSGTLLERYRVIKDISTGELITNINSLSLIDNLKNAALVVLQFNTGCLSKLNPNKKISDLILENNIKLSISYSSSDISYDDAYSIIKKDSATISDITDGFSLLKEKVENMELCNGSAVILDLKEKKIGYTITSAGKLFPNVISTVHTLKEKGYEIYIASGDRAGAINKLTEIIGIEKSHGFDTANPEGKKEIVKSLQNENYKVMMVGDGPNDVKAFNQADISVLTIEQNENYSDNLEGITDYVVDDIAKIIEIDF